LHAEGVEAALPPLGMMVEVPAAALRAADFAADFMSIGSNDLIQYVMAAGRDIAAVGALYDASNPAVLELIERVVEVGERRGIEVSLCGDMASDPHLVPQLLALGLRRLSVAPARLGAIKAAIAGWQPGGHGSR
jgi:phosphotransferase system enzyme I (PtsI)